MALVMVSFYSWLLKIKSIASRCLDEKDIFPKLAVCFLKMCVL